MAAGLVASLIAFAVGAILDFALTTNTDQHGFDLQTVGVVLMVVGAVGALLSVIAFVGGGPAFRRHRRTVDDGHGNVMRQEDTYL